MQRRNPYAMQALLQDCGVLWRRSGMVSLGNSQWCAGPPKRIVAVLRNLQLSNGHDLSRWAAAHRIDDA